MSPDPTLPHSFIDKWRARWPEWRVAEAFVPAPQRPAMAAWFALLQELTDAAWSGADATPGLAKLAWWQEELQGWAGGARRHPLGALLQRLPAPWERLARTLNVLPAVREFGTGSGLAPLQDVAEAVAACEAALFTDGGRHGPGAKEGDHTAAPAPGGAPAPGAGTCAACLLGERAMLAGQSEAATKALDHWGPVTGLRPRRIHAALLRARLRRLASGRPVGPSSAWRVLPMAWRAARSVSAVGAGRG